MLPFMVPPFILTVPILDDPGRVSKKTRGGTVALSSLSGSCLICYTKPGGKGMRGTFCIIDASSYVFRAYHAIRGLTNSQGVATNAVYGYVTMLLKVVKDMAPSHVAVAMDPVEKSFRHGMYPAYKANRPPTPPDLKQQFPYIEPVTRALGLAAVRVEGFEADDVIATLAVRGQRAGIPVTVVSGDKDLMQLVGPGVSMFDPMKDKLWDTDAVKEKFGVPPQQVAEVLAIMGDSSDNVPGVHGIGPKGAAELIRQFGTVEALYGRLGEVAREKVRGALEQHRDDAMLSRKLVELRRDVPIEEDISALVPAARDAAALRELFTFLEFRTLLRDLLPGSSEQASGGSVPVAAALGPVRVDPAAPLIPAVRVETGGPVMPEVQVVCREEQLRALADDMVRTGRASVDTETTSTHPVDAVLVGISVCTAPERVYYVPVGHKGVVPEEQLSLGRVREVLGPILAAPAIRKVGQNFKYDTLVLWNHGFEVEGLAFDTLLASYLLDPGRTSHSLDSLSADFLGLRLITYKEVTSSGSRQVTFDQVPVPAAARYSGEDAWATLLLAERLGSRIESEGFKSLLLEVEQPLSRVLARMEQAGVAIDSAALQVLSREFQSRLLRLEREIFEAAGVGFNLASPKQLAEVLFDKLGLPRGKKTKTGYSTDVSVLEELAPMHPVPRLMLEHRGVAKLKNTYADVLPVLVSRRTGRIHTSFNQAVAATGRLSSSDPNLQNIPIKGEDGKAIRRAFVAGPGMKFVSADYSQIELRVLAHLASDRVLIDAFRRGEDIHSRTAAEIFRVLPGMITPDMRRVAKTINFGIIYGMSAYRLSREQGIPFRQAQSFIDAYFARYSGVSRFLEEAVRQAGQLGYSETMLKRRRPLPELKSGNAQVRGMGERMALNTPVQGGAADIVKLAMLRLDERLAKDRLPARMLLQVHDELVVE
ncbi:MAG: DNA polymerase I, partial [Deltaproteobacteria bacterium]|nr:DNA polymerase I [Deltaproteobacteria bacterium]